MPINKRKCIYIFIYVLTKEFSMQRVKGHGSHIKDQGVIQLVCYGCWCWIFHGNVCLKSPRILASSAWHPTDVKRCIPSSWYTLFKEERYRNHFICIVVFNVFLFIKFYIPISQEISNRLCFLHFSQNTKFHGSCEGKMCRPCVNLKSVLCSILILAVLNAIFSVLDCF